MTPGQIIPPLTVVRLVRAGKNTPQWKTQIGRTFRIGYYSRQDGTDCVWLVNDAGQYEQTADQKELLNYFEVVERSKERALYGANRPQIPPLARSIPHSNGILPLRVKPRSKIGQRAVA